MDNIIITYNTIMYMGDVVKYNGIDYCPPFIITYYLLGTNKKYLLFKKYLEIFLNRIKSCTTQCTSGFYYKGMSTVHRYDKKLIR